MIGALTVSKTLHKVLVLGFGKLEQSCLQRDPTLGSIRQRHPCTMLFDVQVGVSQMDADLANLRAITG